MPKDNRRIIQGVQLYEAGTLFTYLPGMEDELEEVLPADQVDRLKQAGAIEGDWAAKGQAPAPMPGSPASRGQARDARPPHVRQAARQAREARERAQADQGQAEAPPAGEKGPPQAQAGPPADAGKAQAPPPPDAGKGHHKGK